MAPHLRNKTLALVSAAALAAGILSPLSFAADSPVVPTTHAGDTEPLKQLSKASQALYGKVSAGMIRVKVDVNPFAGLPDTFRKEFDEWVKQQSPEGPGGPPPSGDKKKERPERADRPERSDRPERPRERTSIETPAPLPDSSKSDVRRPKWGDGNSGSPVATQPGRSVNPGNSPGNPRTGRDLMFRRFIEERVKNANPENAPKWKMLGMRLEMTRLSQSGDARAVVIDPDGHAVLLGGAIREGQKDIPLKALAPDDSELNVKIVGALVPRGLAIVKLEKTAAATALKTADSRPAPGELLMSIAAGTGAASWIVVPHREAKRTEERFAIPGDERGPTFLFNTDGELSAIGFDRYALPISSIQKDLQWIIENNQDIVPKQLGVKYEPIMPNSPVRTANSSLGSRPAVLVQEIVKDSPADKAGLLKGDIIVNIDKKPIWMLPQILADLSTRTGNAPIGIIRNNAEMTLELPLESPR